MNIWIFNHYAVGPNSSGGTRHFDLAKQLIKRGHQVTIFASSFNHQMLKEEHLANEQVKYKEMISEGVKFIWIKTVPYSRNNHRRVFNMMSYYFKVLKISKMKQENPDVIIGSLVHPLAALAGYQVAKVKKSIFIFEERDLWPQTLIDLGKMSNKNPIISILGRVEKFLFNKSQLIIVLFDKAIGYVESKGVSKNKVLYIPNGYELGRLDNTLELPNNIIEEFEKLKQKKIAIYTGAHGQANNLDTILNSAKKIKTKNENIHFVLIGNGPEKKRLMQRVEEENISNVTMMDPVKKELIPLILQKAHIGLLPLVNSPVFKWGISPNKLFDYMGTALPVILLCDLEGTPVDLSGGGVVIRENFEDELVHFFENMDANELYNMGQKGKVYLEQYHSWEKLSLELEKRMEELLKNN
ncbi:glycosyltransferase [Lysinibacillus capsici]|uniref:Glycosyltransferase n=1 Tax=Lysinibacillus capsici TaxID=2115968 RepID=A0A2X0YAI5_9BACI|nr:glycosyltransferase family 4 protein [Lysinibacillus capsici]SPT99440.1 glycosyltransferase [Lysinibacillus capsici]